MGLKPVNNSMENQSGYSQTRPKHTLSVGSILKNRFVLTHLVATGGTSHIYRARDLLTSSLDDIGDNELAVKITKQFEGNLTSDQISFNEALTTRKLSHCNIIRIFDFDSDEQHSFMTMEYLQGEPLSARLARTYGNKLSYRHAMSVITPIADALAYAHQQGIIHSDIKPGNIIICADNRIKIIDFGTANRNCDHTDEYNSTNTNDYVGYTPAYASPQVLLGHTATFSDDIYSFAFTIYEMLSGQRPYNHKEDHDKSVQELRRINHINIFQWLVLKKALSFDENKRYNNIRKFIRHFKFARYTWKAMALALVLMTAAIFGLTNIDYDTSSLPASEQDNLSQQGLAAKIIEQIRLQQPLSRYKDLNKLEKLQPYYRQAAHSMLADDVIGPVGQYVDDQLYKSTTLPEFDNIISIVDEVLLLYPDSARLVNARRLVLEEKTAYKSALLLQYNDIWANTKFTQEDASTIQAISSKLIQLKLPLPGLDDNIQDRYIHSLNTAIKEFDFIRINELALFQGALPVVRPSLSSDLIHIFQSAKALSDYAQADTDAKPNYPVLAADVFWSPFFSSINKSIKHAWYDKKLFRLKTKLEYARDRIPADYKPINKASYALAEQFRKKARYYTRKGINKRQITLLKRAAVELASTANNKK